MYKKAELISKRNTVFRVMTDEGTHISKEFVNDEDFNKEVEVINILKSAGVKAPTVIKAENKILLLQDLGTLTFLDWYEEQEKNNKSEDSIVYKLCFWLKNFYKAVYEYYNEQKILTDVNFKNFIIKDNEIYGIDFEQVSKGEISEDAGRLLAYALTYDPVMTGWKINFRNRFIDIMSKELNISKDKIISAEKQELAAIEKRRGIKILMGG